MGMNKLWGVVIVDGEAHVMSNDPRDTCYDGQCGGCDGCMLLQAHHCGHRIITVEATDPEAAEAAARKLESK